VIGSSFRLEYSEEEGLIYKGGIEVFDDGPQKPVRIWSRTGWRPALACGNSNGDIPMAGVVVADNEDFRGSLGRLVGVKASQSATESRTSRLIVERLRHGELPRWTTPGCCRRRG
jgi:hypothetical protein